MHVRYSILIDIESPILALFTTSPLRQFTKHIDFFECVDFWPKVFILYTFLGNLTTHITIANNAVGESGAIIMDFSHFTFAETSDKQDSDDANVVQPSAKNQQPVVSTVLITPSIPEIIWAKNVRAIVVCGFLMKSLKKHILKI